MPFSDKEPDRQWRTHACFPPCRSPGDCMLGFDDDDRPQCTKLNRQDGIYCVMPQDSCEVYVNANDVCFGADYGICINWSNIILAIFIANSIQLVFEASLLYALEVTFQPTALEKMSFPDRFNEDGDNQDDNPDQKKELDCGKVMSKCCAEMAFIGSYIFVLCAIVIGLSYSIQFGNPLNILVQFFICWALD